MKEQKAGNWSEDIREEMSRGEVRGNINCEICVVPGMIPVSES